MTIPHVTSVATNAVPTPAATGRLYFASTPLKLAVRAVKTRMVSKPSRNTNMAISSTAEEFTRYLSRQNGTNSVGQRERERSCAVFAR